MSDRSTTDEGDRTGAMRGRVRDLLRGGGSPERSRWRHSRTLAALGLVGVLALTGCDPAQTIQQVLGGLEGTILEPTTAVTPGATPDETSPTPEPDPTAAREDPPRTSTSGEPDGIPDAAQRARVSKIVDGDTIWVSVRRGGGPLAAGAEHKIRLLEYDSPEATTTTECAGPEATAALRNLIPVGTTVWLEADREDTDRYGRFLRYVHRSDGAFVNVVMVRRGWGEAVLYEPNDRHIERMRRAEREARSADRGMWGMGCATGGSSSGGSTGATSEDGSSTDGSDGDCHPAYTPCVPPPPPDLDCGDMDGPITVDHRHGDPHRFDGDGDGTGCES